MPRLGVIGLAAMAGVAFAAQLWRLAARAARAQIAAAVCVRRNEGQLHVLLVRTSDGRRWTFPKGRRDAGETLAQTAAREAGEEAGVSGLLVGDRALTQYRHAPSRTAGRRDDPVAAFLLAVHEAGPSAEPGREPTWFDLKIAGERLAEGRDRDHARELERVVEAAVRALERGSAAGGPPGVSAWSA